MTALTLEDRFWGKVDLAGPDECWNWTAYAPKNGYGQMGMGGKRGKVEYSHRISFSINVGPIPDKACVLHKCDNKKCCNPRHLFLGSIADNVRDMISKNRGILGSLNGASKLDEQQVIAIKGDNRPVVVIAAEFGVSHSVISNIKTGKTWSHLIVES